MALVGISKRAFVTPLFLSPSASWLGHCRSCVQQGCVPTGYRGHKPLRLQSTREFSNTDDDSSDNNKRTAANSSVAKPWSLRWGNPQLLTRRRVGDMFVAMGFTGSFVSSMFSNFSPKQFRDMQKGLLEMQAFLAESNIDTEIEKVISTNLLDNILILGRIQQLILQDKDPRNLVAVDPHSKPSNPIPVTEESLRYAKYAIAAYGDAVIAAAKMDVMGEIDMRIFASGDASRVRISEHVGIPIEDLVVLDTMYTGSSKHLRHFVAVDHANKKVVLAIRGTFSLSETIADVVAFSRPFCGGTAHCEMANMAEKVWEVASPSILDLLDKNEGYGLVISGHSLGAGTAALLNILCHQNNRQLVNGRQVECFTYACPPVFEPLDAAQDAANACTNHIYCTDAVPFLSVDSVRHTLACISAIDNHTRKLGLISRTRLSMGNAKVDPALVEEVQAATTKRLEPKPGAPVLFIPAVHNLWMRRTTKEGGYDVKDCDSKLLASSFGIQMTPSGFFDHIPQRYENALHQLLENQSTTVAPPQ